MQPRTPDQKKDASTTADKKDSFKNKAGDKIEKVGQKIHNIGDSMEKDHKNPSHPRKV